MAEALEHQDDARLFYGRAANYRNLFDQTTQFFRGRKANGRWRMPFTDRGLVGDEYTEADAWQYAFAVQQDVPGMIELYGGDRGFIQKLDALFTTDSHIDTTIPDISGLIGQNSQGDEQCHHVPYLYDYAGAPYKTQQHVRQIMATLYNDTPSGQCGNVDCGQMAAWYIFSSLGFYPLNPNSGIFAIGSPSVTKAVIHLDREKYHGRAFTVEARNNSEGNIYIQSATLNGKPLERPWITRDELISGGLLRFVMGPSPNPEWGSAPAQRPPATMPASVQYPAVPTPASTNEIALSLPIRVVCGSDDPVAGFVPDPNMVAGGANSSSAQIDANASNAAPAEVYQREHYGNDFTFNFPVPENQRYVVRLHFAEIFDNGTGRRIENVYVNNREVLANFDIYAAAGGMNKAIVKEFRGVSTDHRGNISIRITSTAESPDQNAKISAIEIIRDERSSTPFAIDTTNRKCRITIDSSAAPELSNWADHTLGPVLAEWYPNIAKLLASVDFVAPSNVTVTIKPIGGVAYTTDSDIVVSSNWCATQINGQAVGSIVHEMVHVVQQYGNAEVPGWIVEGIADYIRWFKYEPEDHGADEVWVEHQRKDFSPRYNDGYRATANFLNWLTEKYDREIVSELNAAVRERKYTTDFWKEHTGKTAEELGTEWKMEISAHASGIRSAMTDSLNGNLIV